MADTRDGVTPHSYRCEACGGAATWRPSQQQVTCRSCSTIVPLRPDTTQAASFPLVTYLRDSPENRSRDGSDDPACSW